MVGDKRELLFVERRKKLPYIHLCLMLVTPRHQCARIKAEGIVTQSKGKGRGGFSMTLSVVI